MLFLSAALFLSAFAQTPELAKKYAYSANPEAEKVMLAGDAALAKNDYKLALGSYQNALQLDPKLYAAAISITDIYFRMNDFDKAAAAAATAVAIDSNMETGYRYWGTVLEEQGKKAEARDKYIEAYIVDPYNARTASALIGWANLNSSRVSHPLVTIPTSVTTGENGNTNINLDFSVLMGGGKGKKDDDGSSSWMFYGIYRAGWSAGKDGKLSEDFTKAYPNETKYRHSLAEEKDALENVLSMATDDDGKKKKKKEVKLQPSLALLKKINDEGYLEPFILLAKADDGIKQDYPAYLAANRDKLRQYVVSHMITTN
jgi:tetratricopeptide (TPR) repeat protein